MAQTPGQLHRPAAPGLGIATLLLTLLSWSSTPLFLVHFSATIDAWTSNGWRYGFAALLWAPVLLWHALRRTWPRGLARAAVLPALFNATGQMAFAESFYRVDAATATFGLRLQIVFVALGAWAIFPSERALLRKPRAWLAIALVVAGIFGTVATAPGSHLPTAQSGAALAVLAGALFAGYGLAVRRNMARFGSIVAFAAISQYTAAAMIAAMWARGQDHGAAAWALPPGQRALLLLSASIGIALGHVLYYTALARLGVAVSAGVLQLQPFVVAIGSWLLFAQPLSGAQVALGCVAIAGAALLVTTQAQAAATQTDAQV